MNKYIKRIPLCANGHDVIDMLGHCNELVCEFYGPAPIDQRESVRAKLRVLCVCDHGNNRAGTLAQQLKYRDCDVIAAGLKTNEPDTLELLYDWADVVATTARDQVIPSQWGYKVKLYNIGPDIYDRPFNPQLLAIVKRLIREHPLPNRVSPPLDKGDDQFG